MRDAGARERGAAPREMDAVDALRSSRAVILTPGAARAPYLPVWAVP